MISFKILQINGLADQTWRLFNKYSLYVCIANIIHISTVTDYNLALPKTAHVSFLHISKTKQ